MPRRKARTPRRHHGSWSQKLWTLIVPLLQGFSFGHLNLFLCARGFVYPEMLGLMHAVGCNSPPRRAGSVLRGFLRIFKRNHNISAASIHPCFEPQWEASNDQASWCSIFEKVRLGYAYWSTVRSCFYWLFSVITETLSSQKLQEALRTAIRAWECSPTDNIINVYRLIKRNVKEVQHRCAQLLMEPLQPRQITEDFICPLTQPFTAPTTHTCTGACTHTGEIC